MNKKQNTNSWTFKDGYTEEIVCTSFPYAFRALYNAVKKGLESGRSFGEMEKKLYIVSPIRDIYGDIKSYNYDECMQKAKDSGLLTADGTINSKEFKRI